MGRAFMPPLMVNVFDTQTRLSIAQARVPEGKRGEGDAGRCSKA
jgi:hypothetical protein